MEDFKISDKTNKATPVDTDIGLIEEVAGTYKKLTWANIKATLKTYFDTLYLAVTTLTTKGDVLTYSTSATRLGVGTNGQVLTADSAEATGLKWAAGGGGGGNALDIQLPAGAWDRPSTNYAEFTSDVGSNVTMKIEQFDDTTEEFLESQIVIPTGVSGSDTMYFDIWGYAETPTASKNIGLKIQINDAIDSGAWDVTYTTLQDLAVATNSTAGDIQKITLSATLTTLGLVADAHSSIKFSRVISGVSNNLVGDWNFTNMRIYIA
jgi:hypothetical protein